MKDPTWFPTLGHGFYAPKACKESIEALSRLVHEYGTVGFFNRSHKSKKIHEKIRSLLESVPRGSECELWVNGAYALYSLSIYNRISNNRAQILIVTAISLYSWGKLLPLTPELRRDWGEEWSRKNHIMGAYDCDQTRIYFDPTIRPYDLGAVIAHELEHLARDKYAFADGTSYLSDIPSALLLDELLSSMHAGYVQLSFQRDMVRKDPNRVSRAGVYIDQDGIGFQKTKRFRLSGDFELFKRGGHLYRLWENEVKIDGLSLGLPFSDFFERAIYPDFLKELDTGQDSHWGPITDLIRRGYFGGQGPSRDEVAATLQDWYKQDPLLISPLSGKIIETAKRAESSPEKASKIWSDFWSDFRARIQKPTVACGLIRQAILDGKAKNYIGSRLGDSRPEGGEGNRPDKGGEGNRPDKGGEGNRPDKGGEGNRPDKGGEGNRPDKGGEGNRPTIPLTPCLFPDEAL